MLLCSLTLWEQFTNAEQIKTWKKEEWRRCSSGPGAGRGDPGRQSLEERGGVIHFLIL